MPVNPPVTDYTPQSIPPNRRDRRGEVYGLLTVVDYVGDHRWACRCACGNLKILHKSSFHGTKSCGCLLHDRSECRTHGMTGTPEWEAWASMHKRCRNPKHKFYKHYGGRGIVVCERWSSFENFFADMGLRPTSKHSLDRYPDKNGNYEPCNCRWATPKEQLNNTRVNCILTLDGVSHTTHEWADLTGLTHSAIAQRIAAGWSVKDTLQRPLRQIIRRPSHIIEMDGVSKTVSEWARSLGFNVSTLHARLNNGWSIRRALTEPLVSKFQQGRRLYESRIKLQNPAPSGVEHYATEGR